MSDNAADAAPVGRADATAADAAGADASTDDAGIGAPAPVTGHVPAAVTAARDIATNGKPAEEGVPESPAGGVASATDWPVAGDAATTGEPAEEAQEAWSAEDCVPADWSPYVEELDRWKQTDVLLDVPVFYAAPPGEDPVSGSWNANKEVALVGGEESVCRPAMICTQTCDLGATPPGDRNPFVMVTPLVSHSSVVDTEGPSRAKLARQGKLGHLVPVLSPYGDGETWYADLRVQFPLSKGVLLGRNPIDGFTDEADRYNFAEILAMRARRPALHTELSEKLPRALDRFVKDNQGGDAVTRVEQVRLVITGDRLYPTRAQLLVFAIDRKLTDDERIVWQRFQLSAAKLFKDAGLGTGPMYFTDARDCSAELYRTAVPVRCERLNSRIHF